MRVLHICAAYKPAYVYGGPTMSVSMLCEQLVKTGCDIQVFATTANGMHELNVVPNQPALVDGVKVIYFKRLTKDHSHFSPALLKAVWKNARSYDVVHIHAWWNLVSVLSGLIAVLRNVPLLVSARGTLSVYSFHNKNSFVKSLIHHLLGKPVLTRSFIHATSQREYEAVNNLIKSKGITILPNFVKLPVYEVPGKPAISSPLKFLFFSRIEEKKGLDILLKALAGVKTPFMLTIAGDGKHEYLSALKQLAANYGIDKYITWLGFVTDDKFEVLKQHDLFILPSYDENFGNAVIESLSVGTAVLISEQVGLASYVLENKLGWVCKTNALSVSKVIDDISQNYKFDLEWIRQHGPQIVYDNLKEENLVKKYAGMYNSIVTK